MRKIIDVLRLKFEAGLSHERIAAATWHEVKNITPPIRLCRPEGVPSARQ